MFQSVTYAWGQLNCRTRLSSRVILHASWSPVQRCPTSLTILSLSINSSLSSAPSFTLSESLLIFSLPPSPLTASRTSLSLSPCSSFSVCVRLFFTLSSHLSLSLFCSQFFPHWLLSLPVLISRTAWLIQYVCSSHCKLFFYLSAQL